MSDTLLHASQNLPIWCLLLAIALFGMYGERLGWFRRISGALVTILVAAIFVSVRVLPPASNSDLPVAVYDFIFTYFIPLAIPLLLFNVQLKKILKETGSLLLPFGIGVVSVVLGAMVASLLLNLGPETYKVAATFVGTYTGGSVNFMAVATAMDFLESPLFASTITVDNIFTNVYIFLLFLLPGLLWFARWFPSYSEKEAVKHVKNTKGTPNTKKIPLMEQFAASLLITGLIYIASMLLSPILARTWNTTIDLNILLITAIIILLVNILPKSFERYSDTAYELGMFLMYLFLAVIGASSNIADLFTALPGVLIFAAITLVVHLGICLLSARYFKISLQETLIASCACAAGPAVAAPMAVSFGMKKMVSPAIFIGLLGYVVGTFLGVGIGLLLK
ncbi:MAG: DUF819 domain-containing protein [Maribacter sp.]